LTGMPPLPARDWQEELRKHGAGTPEERVRAALRLGEDGLDLFLASAPADMTRDAARILLQRRKHFGRHPSQVAGGALP